MQRCDELHEHCGSLLEGRHGVEENVDLALERIDALDEVDDAGGQHEDPVDDHEQAREDGHALQALPERLFRNDGACGDRIGGARRGRASNSTRDRLADLLHGNGCPLSPQVRRRRPGTPPSVPGSTMWSITTPPAPTVTSLQTLTPSTTVAPTPMNTRSPITLRPETVAFGPMWQWLPTRTS